MTRSERDNLRWLLQQLGIATAGRGRPRKLDSARGRAAVLEYYRDKDTGQRVAARAGVSRATLYREVRRRRL